MTDTEFNPEHRHVILCVNEHLAKRGIALVYLDDKITEDEFKHHEVYKRLCQKFKTIYCIHDKFKEVMSIL